LRPAAFRTGLGFEEFGDEGGEFCGRSGRNRWPPFTIKNRASGMHRARMRPFSSGTIGS
jgi:hypothetical protein